MKIWPAGPKRSAVGLLRPVMTMFSWKPGGRASAARAESVGATLRSEAAASTSHDRERTGETSNRERRGLTVGVAVERGKVTARRAVSAGALPVAMGLQRLPMDFR